MKVTVEFAQIDAKDGICGYDVVAFVDIENDKKIRYGPKNGVLAMAMHRTATSR